MDGLTGTKGGSGVWQRIISEMPAHDVYIEAFWGRGTIAKRKRPARYTIGVDLDPAAISSGTGSALMFLADGVQWLADYFRLPLSGDSATTAGHAGSRGGRQPHDFAMAPGNGQAALAASSRVPRSTSSPDAGFDVEVRAATFDVEVRGAESRVPAEPDRLSATKRARPYSTRGQSANNLPQATHARALVASGAAARDCTFGGVSWERHFVYLDPPYLGYSGYYRHELTEDEHRVLCRLFRRLPCPAALSGYRSEIYAAELRGCRSIDIATVNRAGRRVHEIVWMNYEKPARYHDIRFVGNCRRQRERIRRRVKTWSEGLMRMKPAERQAVFQACAAAYHGIAGQDAETVGGARAKVSPGADAELDVSRGKMKDEDRRPT